MNGAKADAVLVVQRGGLARYQLNTVDESAVEGAHLLDEVEAAVLFGDPRVPPRDGALDVDQGEIDLGLGLGDGVVAAEEGLARRDRKDRLA